MIDVGEELRLPVREIGVHYRAHWTVGTSADVLKNNYLLFSHVKGKFSE